MSQIKVGALLSYATVVVSIVLGLVYTPWMISVIGQSNYGLYTLAMSVIAIFMMDFGLGTAVSRFLSKFYAENDHQAACSFLGLAYRCYLFLAIVIAVVLAVVYGFIDSLYAALNEEELQVFKSLYVVVSLYSVVSVPFLSQNNVLLANEKFIALKGTTLLQKLIAVLLTVVALILGFGVFALVLVNALVNVLFIAVKYYLIRKLTSAKATYDKLKARDVKEFASFSGWVTVTQIAQRCGFNLMPSILGVTSGSMEIAVFGLASTLEGYVYTAADAIGGLFLPRVSQYLLSDSPSEAITDLMVKVGRCQLFVVGLIFTGFIALGYPFVHLWLGAGYSAVWPCALLVIFPSMLTMPQQIGDVAMTASNHVKNLAKADVVMALTGIVIGVAITPSCGAYGGCIAIMLSYLVNRVIVTRLLYKYLGINLKTFYCGVYLPWLFMAAVPVVALAILQSFMPCSTWPIFLAYGLLFVLFYGALLWLTVLTDDEKGMFTTLLVGTRSKDNDQ